MSSSISTKMNTNDGSRLSRSFLLFLFSINEAPCHPGFVSSPPLSLFVLACIDLLLGLGQNSSFLSLSFRFPFFFEVKHAVGCSWADVCCCCYCCWCFSTCTSTYISFEFFFSRLHASSQLNLEKEAPSGLPGSLPLDNCNCNYEEKSFSLLLFSSRVLRTYEQTCNGKKE